MHKFPRTIAIALTAAALMTVSAPAFAENADPGVTQNSSIENCMGFSDSVSEDYMNQLPSDTQDQTESAGVNEENASDSAETDIVSEAENAGEASASSTSETVQEDEQKTAFADEKTGDTEEKVCVPYINEKGEKVYTGKYATAYITGDGYSGYITVTDTSIWDNEEGLTEIGGHPLSDIIRFRYSGSVSNINIEKGGWIYKYRVNATGSAGKGTAKMHFYDETNDNYGLDFWDEDIKTHYVDYNSDEPNLKTIFWYSAGEASQDSDNLLYDLDTTKDWPVPEKNTCYEMADGWTIYKDQYATACVPPANTSDDKPMTARIYITDFSIWKDDGTLSEINGIPLSEICKLGNAYAASIKLEKKSDNNYTVKVRGAGNGVMESIFEGNDFQLTFIDQTKDYYDLGIWDTSEGEHTVNSLG